MFHSKAQIAALLSSVLAACGQAAPPAAPASQEGGYVEPPAIVAATSTNGGVRLVGSAPAGSLVRLATPQGDALTVSADAGGRWRLVAARDPAGRIFGLSARVQGRPVQAEGYVFLGPNGEAALLRAGASAVRLDAPSGPGVASLDLDVAGGALVSGVAEAGSNVALRLDGGTATEVRSDANGRFSLSLPRLSVGPHRIEAVGPRLSESLAFEVAPSAPLTKGPMRIVTTADGLRADWLTPGGGVQTTILPRAWSSS